MVWENQHMTNSLDYLLSLNNNNFKSLLFRPTVSLEIYIVYRSGSNFN